MNSKNEQKSVWQDRGLGVGGRPWGTSKSTLLLCGVRIGVRAAVKGHRACGLAEGCGEPGSLQPGSTWMEQPPKCLFWPC